MSVKTIYANVKNYIKERKMKKAIINGDFKKLCSLADAPNSLIGLGGYNIGGIAAHRIYPGKNTNISKDCTTPGDPHFTFYDDPNPKNPNPSNPTYVVKYDGKFHVFDYHLPKQKN